MHVYSKIFPEKTLYRARAEPRCRERKKPQCLTRFRSCGRIAQSTLSAEYRHQAKFSLSSNFSYTFHPETSRALRPQNWALQYKFYSRQIFPSLVVNTRLSYFTRNTSFELRLAPMDSWTAEFCTVCDKQCFLGSVYCSDACREADHCSKQRFYPLSPSQPPAEVSAGAQDTDSSDENSEIPNFWLAANSSKSRRKVSSKLRSAAPKATDLTFRYASPILKPQKPSGATAVSPLLIPKSTQASPPEKMEQISAQSVSTYKRWLSQGTA